MKRPKSLRTGVIQPLPGIGDMMWLLPALKAIAASAPDGHIILYTKPSTQARKVFISEPFVASVMDLPFGRGLTAIPINFAKTWWALWKTRPERLYILHQSFRYRLAARLAGIKKIIPYPSELARSKDNGWVKSLRFLEQEKIPIANRNSRLYVSPDIVQAARHYFHTHPEPWFVVAAGASEAVRCWPPDRFATCVDAIADIMGGTVFLTGSKGEATRVEEIFNACKRKEHIVSATGLSFEIFMGLLASSQGLLGNDSGPANLAAALGVRAFVIAGITDSPIHSPFLHMIRPDQSEKKKNMQTISTEQVLQLLRTQLKPYKKTA